MTQLSFEGRLRDTRGTSAARKMRRELGLFPAVVYGGQGEVISITLTHDDVIAQYKNAAFYNEPMALTIEGKTESVRVQDIQMHPYKQKILHIDFVRA